MFTLNSMSSAIRKLYCMVLACCCMLPSLSYSAAWQFEPAIALQGSYDDNARLDPDVEDSVYGAKLSPTLQLARYTDITTLNGFLRLDFNKYWGDTDDFSAKDNQLAGLSVIRKIERGRLGLRGTFKRDTVLRSVEFPDEGVDDDLIVPPDPSVDDNSTRENIRRYRYDVNPTMTYDLTERWQVGLGYRYQNTFYGKNDTNNDGEDDLFDFDRHAINGRVSVPVTEKNKLVSTLLVSRYDSDSNRTTDNFELQTGLRHEFDETTNVTLTLGGRYTRFDDDDNNSGSDSSTGWVARLAALKTTGLTTFDGSLERKLSPSGVGDEVETDELRFNAKRQLTEFISFALSTRLFENETIGSVKTRNNNRRFLSVQPALIWTLTESWSVSTAYRYRRQKDFDEPDSASSNAVFLTLLYKPLTELGK